MNVERIVNVGDPNHEKLLHSLRPLFNGFANRW